MKKVVLLFFISLVGTSTFAQIIPGAPVVHDLRCGFPKNKFGHAFRSVEYRMVCITRASAPQFLKSCTLYSHEVRLNGLVHTFELTLTKQSPKEADFVNEEERISVKVDKTVEKSGLWANVNLDNKSMLCIYSGY